ncbi:MAG: ATP-dependent 6-phosphofructokinase [Eubacteriales bacterium]
MKTIGVLTSGGDSQGMNAAIRAITRAGIANGMKVIGIRRGYEGLMTKDTVELTMTSVSNILNKGGTMLHSARSKRFATPEGVEEAKQACIELGIEGIVVCGGDGSFRGARDLTLAGIPCVGIPCTIDNDIVCTDDTIGYDTATNIVTELVDRLHDTSESHDRCSVVQIMGNGAGWLTLQGSTATGATCTIVPEVKFDLDKDVVEKIKYGKSLGLNAFVVMVSEGIFANKKTNVNYDYVKSLGINNVYDFARKIEELTGVESRETVLGHVQRGGVPTAHDRILATNMGVHAVNLLKNGISNRVVVIRDGKITDMDILEALAMKKPFDAEKLAEANMLNL